MMVAFLKDERGQGALIAAFFLVGIIGHLVLLNWMLKLTPIVLWFFGIVTVSLSVPRTDCSLWRDPETPRKKAFLWWILGSYIVTFALEAIGTTTGAIFGPYTYGDVLGLSLFHVPFVIGFNWVLVILGALRFAQPLPFWAAIPTAALFAVGFDYLLEPVAIGLGYWTWHWDGIPLQNYIAWFLIALVMSVVFRLLKIRLRSRLPAYYVIIQVLFFTALRILGVV